jgi:hypothetical protein
MKYMGTVLHMRETRNAHTILVEKAQRNIL